MVAGKNRQRLAFGLVLTVGWAGATTAALAGGYIVKEGQAVAEIIVPEHPCDSVAFAAKELQKYIAQMADATLPIVPDFAITGKKENHLLTQYPIGMKRMPVKIYLGHSFHTDRLGLEVEDLDWGAYRMKSGKGWLALLGKDTDFVPTGVWGRTRSDWRDRGSKEWEAATAPHHWGNPVGTKMWNRYSRSFNLWAYEQKGTLNAVYGFLRSLGVRWYMPGDLGEVVPKARTIELPKLDKTVRPDCKIRRMSFVRYGNGPHIDPEILWSLRIGVNHPYGFHTYHGLAPVTRPEQTRKNHPEFYALYNGKRDTESRTPNPCLSSEKLLEENVRYLRFMFDMFDVPAMSVWPDDGFTCMCQCEKCKGKDKPERGRQGVLSDYVWEYVNRVAAEVARTHPDKLIIGGAYSTYWLPPENIDKLNPNVAVHIVNARRRYDIPEEDARARRETVRKWARLTGNKVITFMNYGGGANTPHIFAEDIKALKGLTMGEDMWVAHHRGGLAKHGFNHLNYYVCSRLWWDIDQDVDALLDEYYRQFYGPAAKEMEAFIDFYEPNQNKMRGINSAPVIKKALDLFAEAEKKVDSDSAYGQRVAMFAEGLTRIRKFYEQIKDGRDDPPVFGVVALTGDVRVDGNLNEAFWGELPGTLKGLRGGGDVKFPTRFKIGLTGNSLYVGVKCFDQRGASPNAAKTERKDDSALWHGDAVELLLETPMHSYYQIAINPAGAVCDLDRSVPLSKGFTWSAEANIATRVNEKEGYWTIEAKTPFTPSTQDPLHEIIGPAPAKGAPWFFNVCRQRVRDQGVQMSAFSPTGEKGFHYILKFGKLFIK